MHDVPSVVPPPRRPPGGGSTGSGRRWEVRRGDGCVTVTAHEGAVAGVQVRDRDHRLMLEFWTASPALPVELRRELVRQAFTHPAVRPGREVLACTPTGDSEVLTAVRDRVSGARSRVAGATCLVEGTVARDR